MQIDSALAQYANRPLRVPGGNAGTPQGTKVPSPGARLSGTGARLADSRPVDRSSPLYEQCREFESIFMKMMLKEMRNTVEKSGLMDGGWAENIFQDMLDDEYSKGMAETANFGLADQIYRQLAEA